MKVEAWHARIIVMTTGKQIHLLMRDMLFITWAVEPEVLRKLVPPELELDTRPDSAGKLFAFVSAVCFRVAEVRSSVIPFPRMSFEQVNYRAYASAGNVPSVYFLDMRVNSRMVTAVTSFLRVPVFYEDIDITAASLAEGNTDSLRYSFKSPGLNAVAVVGERPEAFAADPEITPEFLTQRLVGYASAGDGVFKIEVEQAGLVTSPARVDRVQGIRLEELGVLSADQATQPHSALYVRESLFGTNPPSRVW